MSDLSTSTRIVAVSTSTLDRVMPFVRQFYEHFGYQFDPAIKRAVLARFIGDESLGRLFLIERGGETIGYALVAFSFGLEFDGRVAFIDELFVDPAARSEGIGAWALSEIEKWCASIEIQVVRLEADVSNERATALYMRHGYTDRNRRLLTKVRVADQMDR